MKKGFRRRHLEIWLCAVLSIVNAVFRGVPSYAFLPPLRTTFRRVENSFASASCMQVTTSQVGEVTTFSSNPLESYVLIRAIKNCTTVTQVQEIFLSTDFKPTSHLVNATSWSSFPHFQIAAAALCKSTKLMAKDEQSLGQPNFTILPVLLKEIATVLVLAQRPTFQPSTGPLPICMNSLSDLLLSLEWISLKSKTGPNSIRPLARSLLVVMDQQFHLNRKLCLGPFRIWECFQACFHLGLIEGSITEITNQTSPQQRIVAILGDRVTKGDVLAALPPRKLAEGLGMAQSLLQNGTWNPIMAEPLVKAFGRRLRKASIREHATSREWMQALVAARQIVMHNTPLQHDVAAADDDDRASQQQPSLLYPELKAMAYTLSNDVLLMHEKNSSLVSFAHLRQLLPIMLAFQFHVNDHQDDHQITHSMVDVLCHKLSLDPTLRDASEIHDLQNIIWSLAYAKPRLHRKQPELFLQCGKRLENRFLVGKATTAPTTGHPSQQPRLLNSILRGAILMHKENATVLEPFVAACLIALADDTFLAASSAAELSNFVWFLSMAHVRGSDHVDVLDALAQRMLQPDIVDTMTSKQAIACLKSFVAFSYEKDEDSESSSLENVVISLMEGLAGHLLSTQLSPAEASSALYAYARSNYLQDMGIFDHLTNVMAAQLSRASVRQVATSLWACGRMMRFEQGHDDVTYEAHEPPYWRNAQTFFRHLAERSQELNSADTSQALWAIGHLGVAELSLVTPLLDRAVELTSQLSAQEIANIIWGISKVLEQGPSITVTARHQIAQLTQAILSLQPNAQEISNVLYALSVLEMADQATFLQLAQKMMKQIDHAEAQAISNALWAFQTSDLPPPRQLLDLWAAPKLGWIKVPTTPDTSPKRLG